MRELVFHGPEGAIFFIWSEFALLASRDAINAPHAYEYGRATWTSEDWLHLAARLIRAQHVFWRSFAKLGPDGLPHPEWSFASYSKDHYTPVLPEVVNDVGLTALTRDEIDTYATRCLWMAMPAGIVAPS